MSPVGCMSDFMIKEANVLLSVLLSGFLGFGGKIVIVAHKCNSGVCAQM